MKKTSWIKRQFKGQHPHCHYCGHQLTLGHGRYMATKDHKKPRAAGGTSTCGNVVLACLQCNNRKGDMPYEDFIAMLRQERADASTGNGLQERACVHPPSG